jgi:hypothetical protein
VVGIVGIVGVGVEGTNPEDHQDQEKEKVEVGVEVEVLQIGFEVQVDFVQILVQFLKLSALNDSLGPRLINLYVLLHYNYDPPKDGLQDYKS